MTLTSHAVAGAAVATLVPQNPILAFVFGFLSHFLLDAFPHGHYSLRSHIPHPENKLNEDMILGWNFILDLIKIGFDFALGMALAYFLFAAQSHIGIFAIMLGALAGTLPDALHFIYWKIRKEPLISFEKFHISIQAIKHFDGNTKMTLLVEIAAIVASILFVKFASGQIF